MEEYINLAYNQALKSTVHNQYGAVIIYRNKVIGIGNNSLTTGVLNYKSSKYIPNKYSTHAEKSCIMSVKNKNLLNKCKIIIVKIVNGKPVLRNCCDMCSKLINKYKINNPFKHV